MVMSSKDEMGWIGEIVVDDRDFEKGNWRTVIFNILRMNSYAYIRWVAISFAVTINAAITCVRNFLSASSWERGP